MTTLLGISGSLTAGGSTRTVVDAALAAAQAPHPGYHDRGDRSA